MKRTLFLVILFLTILSACSLTPQGTPDGTLPSTTPLTDTGEVPPGETLTGVPTEVPTIMPTETVFLTPTLSAGASQVSPIDGMILMYVPAGPFPMGSEAGYSDERPVHTVDLPAFWVDQTEVTNGKYALCVDAGVCARPSRKSSNLIDIYFDGEAYADYPVLFVTWQNAVDYCTWAGRRLPTEAEWEKAARGTDGREYPWGSSQPDDTLANFSYKIDDIVRTGSFPVGASPYGALDMAGNVFEWTADWYGEDYYASSPAVDPTGPETGIHRSIRGGSWTSNAMGVRSAHRYIQMPDEPEFDLGFRCVMDAQP
jgi:eukaryotic-like serine/threonine-protein kinase